MSCQLPSWAGLVFIIVMALGGISLALLEYSEPHAVTKALASKPQE